MMPAISLNALPALPPFQFLPEAELNFDAVLATVAPPAPQPPAAPEVSEPSETLLNFLGINPVKGQLPISDSPPVKDELSNTAEDELSVLPPVAEPLLTLPPLAPVPPLAPAIPASQPINEAVEIAPPAGAPLPRLAITETQSKPSPAINAEENRDASTAGRPDPALSEFAAPVSPQLSKDTTKTPPAPILNPFVLAPGGPLSKPPLSFNDKKEGSIPTGSAQSDLGVSTSPQIFDDTLTPTTPSSGGNSGGLRDFTNTPTPSVITAPSADPLHFVVNRQLDLERDSRWLDALARDIVAVADAPDRLSFRLSPPQLGQLDVDLSSSDSGLSVRMNASTDAAAQIVAAAQPRLIDELKSQGVRVAEAQVSTGGGGSQGQGQPQQQRDADQMIEFVRQRIERNNDTNLTRPTGRFA
jgi:flagellar hook-length control protein FliK